MTIREIPLSEDEYPLKATYSMIPEFIIIHNTANDAAAQNEITYMQRDTSRIATNELGMPLHDEYGNIIYEYRDFRSFHYAVDDNEAILGVPLDRNTWQAGDGDSGPGNRNGISIEICYSKSGGGRFEKAMNNGAELSAMILNERGWNIAHVKKHQDFGNLKHCPHRILDDYGWQYFLDLVQGNLNAIQAPKESGVSNRTYD